MTFEEIANAAFYLLEDLKKLEVEEETPNESKRELKFIKKKIRKLMVLSKDIKDETDSIYDTEALSLINFYFHSDSLDTKSGK